MTAKSQSFKSVNINDSLVLSSYIPKSLFINDSLKFADQLQSTLSKLYTDGYLEAGYVMYQVDSLFQSEWIVGKLYNWGYLRAGNLPEFLISKIGYRDKFYRNNPFSQREFSRLFNSILSESDNSGHPFAFVRLDSLEIKEEEISGVIYYDAGPEITFDQLLVSGTDRITSDWLSAYLGIRNGDLYNQKVVDEINLKIESLPFLKLEAEPSVAFQNSQATVELIVSYQKSNSLDGIIGFLPNEQQQGELLVTGQLFLGLNNLFNSGKSLVLEWQSLKARSQLLDINYAHPNLFSSPIDLEAKFNLLKEDTFFINREIEVATSYRKAKGAVSLFFRSRNSSILSEIINENDVTDFSINYYGLSYKTASANFSSGNTNAYQFMLESAVGSKKEDLISNDSLEILSTEVNSIQYQFISNLSKKTKLTNSLNLYLELQGGLLLNDNNLYRNDLFRIGGLRSIRGFNENFFFADQYAILRSELRLYYQADSYLFLFYDQSYLQTAILDLKGEDYPLGIGLGMALKVKGGTVNMAYGVGKSNDQELDVRLSKFHFGYIARF